MNLTVDILRSLLREQDIEGFIDIHGAPNDEYDSEADVLYTRLTNYTLDGISEEVIEKIISEIWEKYFGLDEGDLLKRKSEFKNLAEKIISLI